MGARQFIFVDNLMMSNFNFTLIVEEEQRKRGEIKFTILLKENIHKRLSYSLYLHKSHQVKSHSYYSTHIEKPPLTYNLSTILVTRNIFIVAMILEERSRQQQRLVNMKMERRCVIFLLKKIIKNFNSGMLR